MSYRQRCTLLSLLTCLGMLMLRPAVLGGNLTPLGIGLFCLIIFLTYLSLPTPNAHAGTTDAESVHFSLVQTLMNCTLWLYCLFVATLKGQSNPDFIFKSFAAAVVISICTFGFSFWRDLKDQIFVNFAKLNALVGWSIAITWGLLKIIPYSTLRYFTIPIKNYETWPDNGDVLFPFSIMYGRLIEYDIYRFSGLFRETGIAQLFFVWSLVLLHDRKSPKFWQLGALLGILLCGSSIALLTLLVSLFIYHGLNARANLKIRVGIAVVGLLLVAGSIFMPGIGLKDKQTTHAASMNDRTEAIGSAFSDPEDLWLGKGLYYKYSPYEGMGINAISQIYYTGVIGFVLHMSIFAAGLLMAQGVRRQYAALAAPPLLTNLFFQPLMDAPTVYILLHYVPMAHLMSARGKA